MSRTALQLLVLLGCIAGFVSCRELLESSTGTVIVVAQDFPKVRETAVCVTAHQKKP